MLSIAFPYINWPAKWTYLIQKCEVCIHETKVSLVASNKPTNKCIKIKTDGTTLENLGTLGVEVF